MQKSIYAACLAGSFFVSFFLFNKADPHFDFIVNEQAMKAASVFNTNANWWQKTDTSEPVKKHHKVTINHPEKLTDFLEFSPSQEWQPVSAQSGVAIANYQLDSGSKSYRMAIIRMKKAMPLTTIMNIWQQKAGLPASDNFTAVKTLKSHNDKLLNLYQINGVKQSIALAVHAGDKYTFFRLSGDDHIDEKVLVKFTELISSASII